MATAVTWKVRVTEFAGAYVAFPDCEAVIEQVPDISGVTFVLLKEQIDGELIVSVTVNPDVAEEVSVCSLSMVVILDGCRNVSVCAKPSIVKVRVTSAAGSYSELPS